MTCDLSEYQLLFRDTVERFIQASGVEARRASRTVAGGVDRSRWGDLAGLGMLALPADIAVGGLGGTVADCAIVAEAIGCGLMPEPWLECGYLPLRLLRDHPLAARIIDGTALVALALAEPGQRYNPLPKTVRAMRTDDGYLLSGTKTFILGGAAADFFLVSAAMPEGPALFVVPAGRAEIRAYAVIDGGRAAEMQLHDAFVKTDCRLSTILIEDSFAETRLMAAAEMVGLTTRLLEDTISYVGQREQFGQPIGRFQAIQHRLVDAYVMLELMRATLRRVVTAPRDGNGRWQADIAGAKGFIAERGLLIGHEAIQMHGGMGMTDELAIGHAHKRLVLLSRLFGDPATDLATYAMAV